MYTFDQVSTFFVVFVAILGLVILIGNVASTLKKWRSEHYEPLEKVEGRVDNLEDRMEKVEEKLVHDWDFRQEELEFNKLMMLSMKQIVKHLTHTAKDDREVEQLEAVEGDIDRFLVEHQG